MNGVMYQVILNCLYKHSNQRVCPRSVPMFPLVVVVVAAAAIVVVVVVVVTGDC